jgi:hypothetical protein
MRAYKVVFTDTEAIVHARYAGTQADARTERDAFVNDFGVKKSAVEIEEIEIPMAKPELLAWINALL